MFKFKVTVSEFSRLIFKNTKKSTKTYLLVLRAKGLKPKGKNGDTLRISKTTIVQS